MEHLHGLTDDEALVVNISNVARLRKLRHTEADTSVSGVEYAERLRQQCVCLLLVCVFSPFVFFLDSLLFAALYVLLTARYFRLTFLVDARRHRQMHKGTDGRTCWNAANTSEKGKRCVLSLPLSLSVCVCSFLLCHLSPHLLVLRQSYIITALSIFVIPAAQSCLVVSFFCCVLAATLHCCETRRYPARPRVASERISVCEHQTRCFERSSTCVLLCVWVLFVLCDSQHSLYFSLSLLFSLITFTCGWLIGVVRTVEHSTDSLSDSRSNKTFACSRCDQSTIISLPCCCCCF